MNEQQAHSPIDDLFRKTFENLPDAPAASGWDTPSERVWEHIQANISKPRSVWGAKSLVLIATLAALLTAGLYWLVDRPTEKPAPAPPATAPSVAPAENQPVATPKASTDHGATTSDPQGKPAPPRKTGEEPQAKPGKSTAQPLPGSKPTLPPNTTEAQKKEGGNN